MLLKEVMTTHVQGIAAHQTIREAAQVMERLRVGAVPVFQDGRPIGIVTDRDIVIRGISAGLDCNQTHISEVMSNELVSLPEDTDIKTAARQMEERQIRRLLVTGESGEIVGIVSIGDIAAKAGQHGLSAELIETVSQPAQPTR